jgi:preprotein translocase subunit SecG
MSTLIAGIMLLAAVLLTLLVFIQNSKGGGISSEFGGAAQLGGVQRTTNFVEKATYACAVIIMISAITLTSMEKSEKRAAQNTTKNK